MNRFPLSAPPYHIDETFAKNTIVTLFSFVFCTELINGSFSLSYSMIYLIKVLEGLKAVPLTEAEKDECSQVLTPQELFQVAVGRYLNW